jgi:hypothetical protein
MSVPALPMATKGWSPFPTMTRGSTEGLAPAIGILQDELTVHRFLVLLNQPFTVFTTYIIVFWFGTQ